MMENKSGIEFTSKIYEHYPTYAIPNFCNLLCFLGCRQTVIFYITECWSDSLSLQSLKGCKKKGKGKKEGEGKKEGKKGKKGKRKKRAMKK